MTTAKLYTWNGETKNITDWSRDPRCSVSQTTLRNRLNNGWDFEKALQTPPKVPSTGLVTRRCRGTKNIHQALKNLINQECTWEPERQPDEPIRYRPGTPEKIEQLRRRVNQGQDMWHPDDVNIFCDGRGNIDG